MEQLTITLEELVNNSKESLTVFRPSFFRLTNENDRTKFNNLLKQSGITVHDGLHEQLMELLKAYNPTRKFTSKELSNLAIEHLKNTPIEEYGVWVYYPWLNKLIHLLDKDEYRVVRTNRNHYKITPEEQDILSTKKIGVLGLSVGQAVAVTLAMERCFEELRLADFDILELSNLNRIRSGVQDLGILKTVSTARQISEIDPFLKVTCFHNGVTEENIDAFFTNDGLLDMVVDECDGLDIKIVTRLKARELGVPVIMETSDRGMIDIERFDLEQDRPIMHGLIEHLDQNPANLKGLSNEEKIPYILPMLGLDTMSDRLKASMLEVEQSITTWPQLASDVILGGAVAANVCRRISLGQLEYSGRFFVDLNGIISPDKEYQFTDADEAISPDTDFTEEANLEGANLAYAGQLELSKEQVTELVEAAILAPSGGNNQPWNWLYENQTLSLFLDESKTSSFLDYASAGSYLSLGAATENLILQAHKMGLEVKSSLFPDDQNSTLVAAFHFFDEPLKGADVEKTHQYDTLVDSIKIRLTNRLIRERVPIELSRLEALTEVAKSEFDTQLHFVQSDDQLEAAGKLIASTDRILITNKQGHHAFVNEIRWSAEEANKTKDGLDIATIDLSAGEAAGFRMAKKWSVVKTLNNWGGGSVFQKLSTKCVAGASALGLLTMPVADSEAYFKAGKILERIWLYSNATNIALQPMTGLPFLLHRLHHGNGEGLTRQDTEDLHDLENKLRILFSLKAGEWPVFLFRLCIAEEPTVKSLRRPVNEVLTYNPVTA